MPYQGGRVKRSIRQTGGEGGCGEAVCCEV